MGGLIRRVSPQGQDEFYQDFPTSRLLTSGNDAY